jgi:hypothetical protein
LRNAKNRIYLAEFFENKRNIIIAGTLIVYRLGKVPWFTFGVYALDIKIAEEWDYTADLEFSALLW